MEEALLTEIVSLLRTIRTGVVAIEVIACVAFLILLGKLLYKK